MVGKAKKKPASGLDEEEAFPRGGGHGLAPIAQKQIEKVYSIYVVAFQRVACPHACASQLLFCSRLTRVAGGVCGGGGRAFWEQERKKAQEQRRRPGNDTLQAWQHRSPFVLVEAPFWCF